MTVIAPVFHPRAKVSAHVEVAVAAVMAKAARAEGHRAKHAKIRPPKPLTEIELGYVRLAREKLGQAMSASAVARELGIRHKYMSDLLARSGTGRDGTEVVR
ncbi:hypothetical protein ATO6_15435 [Oceanicola sp. 22II-s10i]|uniref:hypothetical protein n=1 Tax=Oceanicola sp. 22II-s10i TaxID=1317116 RepID=UPI000B5258B7|nr:hypothetical protein [Oceanicola sp. 22II-s10i]OWU83820.1 hypothetical protein ATO6_15435 [Oceanicola sp. 22II-s10i]